MREALRGKVILACAPNGARRTKADHAALPLTASELADDARQIRDAGACLLHLHVRDAKGAHSLDAGRYRDAIAAVRDQVGDDLIIQITTEAVGIYDVAAQMEVVRALRPEAASCALRELCPSDADVARYADFLRECRDAGIWVQHILYDDHDAQRFLRLRESRAIDDSAPFVLLVIGHYGASPKNSDLRDLPARAAPFLDGDVLWSVCAFGAAEAPIAVAAARLGGHPRIGFENNLTAADGQPAQSNAAQITNLARALRTAAIACASAQEIRTARAATARR